MPDPDPEPRPLTPEARARKGCAGTPLDLGTSGTWLLPAAYLARALDPVRERLFERIEEHGKVTLGDAYEAGWSLLIANYDLSGEEAATLLGRADHKVLVDAVIDSLIVPTDIVRGYGDWVRSSLLANGLDPARIPAEDLPHVLHTLEQTGRAVPLEDFASIHARIKKIRELRG